MRSGFKSLMRAMKFPGCLPAHNECGGNTSQKSPEVFHLLELARLHERSQKVLYIHIFSKPMQTSFCILVPSIVFKLPESCSQRAKPINSYFSSFLRPLPFSHFLPPKHSFGQSNKREAGWEEQEGKRGGWELRHESSFHQAPASSCLHSQCPECLNRDISLPGFEIHKTPRIGIGQKTR